MKKHVLQLIFGAAFTSILIVLLAQCTSDASEMAQLDAMAADRGTISSQAKNLCLCLNNQYPKEALSETEAEALLFMREEEKLARDVYTVFYDKWNARIFSNIAGAEQRHMDAMFCLIKKYGLTDPVGDNPAGVFKNPALQTLYNTLVAEGASQKVAALTVGAKIEDLDIYDLLRLKPAIDNADVLAVFDELNRGSRNHLRAYVQNLDVLNQTYEPEFISPELFQDIIGTPRETGGAICGTCPNANNPNCTGTGKQNANCPNGPGNGTGTCIPGGNGNNNGNGKGRRN